MLNAHSEIVILFYNTFWGRPLEAEGLALPEGCVFTTDRSRLDHAAAVVFHVPQLDEIRAPAPQKRKGQMWVSWSMECESHRWWSMDPRFLAHFDLTMTYRLNSDVPVPYYDPSMLGRLQTAPKAKDRGAPAACFISSPADLCKRVEFAQALMENIDVHSFGKRLQNRRLLEDTGPATKLDVISNYKFTLAFENAMATDYVTEKFFEPLIAGSVPVYRGAPNIAEFAPGEHCFIDATDFKSPKDLAEYLRSLDQDDSAYERYLEWKRKPLRAEFVQKVEAVLEPRPVALCRKVLELRKARVIDAVRKKDLLAS